MPYLRLVIVGNRGVCSCYWWRHVVKPNRKSKNKWVNTESNVIMKQCWKNVFYLAVAADEKKNFVFNSLIGGSFCDTSSISFYRTYYGPSNPNQS